jgi:META domain
MVSFKSFSAAIALCIVTSTAISGVARAEEFPFGMEMTLDAARMPGSKRVPDLEIGDNGEVVVELWCKGGKGQFSVAGSTVIFVAGAFEARNCPADRAQADDDLLAALSSVTNWKRQGDLVLFIGPKTLRFRINTN